MHFNDLKCIFLYNHFLYDKKTGKQLPPGFFYY